MAQKQYNSVIYFNLAGTGIVPGIVLTSRLEQIPGTQDTQEVLSVLYAHPEDEQHAIHKAKDIGDVKFTLKPSSATNHFGWADTAEGAVPPEPETVEPVATEPSVPELAPVEGVATLPPISADHASEPPQQIDRDYPTWKEAKYQEDGADAAEAVATEVPQDEKVSALLAELNDRQTELDQADTLNGKLKTEVDNLTLDNDRLRQVIDKLHSALAEKAQSAEPQPSVPTFAEHDAAVASGDVTVVEPEAVASEPQPDVPAPTENPVTEPTPADAVPESAA